MYAQTIRNINSLVNQPRMNMRFTRELRSEVNNLANYGIQSIDANFLMQFLQKSKASENKTKRLIKKLYPKPQSAQREYFLGISAMLGHTKLKHSPAFRATDTKYWFLPVQNKGVLPNERFYVKVR